ncbi:MAG: hypothetical protein AB8G96_14405 [Phycisphaerales bacterium]
MPRLRPMLDSALAHMQWAFDRLRGLNVPRPSRGHGRSNAAGQRAGSASTPRPAPQSWSERWGRLRALARALIVRSRQFGSSAPWLASLLLHAVMIIFGLLVSWAVAVVTDDEPAPVIVADFRSLEYEPLARVEQTPEPQPEPVEVEAPVVEVLPDPPPLPEPVIEAPPVVEPDAPVVTVTPTIPVPEVVPMTPPAPAAVNLGADFVGTSSSNARTIVYVIDASGSMIRTLPIVVDELRRSLERLDPVQEFAVVFFQRNTSLLVPPRRLQNARPDRVRNAMAWIDEHVIPEGRSNPVAAIESAIRLKPDVIFLLSENITGSGEFEIDADELLRRVDRLNPRDRRTGRRPVQINCIQFMDADPLRTLERIAEEHGGERGFVFLSRRELGLGG